MTKTKLFRSLTVKARTFDDLTRLSKLISARMGFKVSRPDVIDYLVKYYKLSEYVSDEDMEGLAG